MNHGIIEPDKHVDPLGISMEPIQGSEINTIKLVLFSISRPGSARGNHYHLGVIGWLLAIRRSAKLVCKGHFTKKKDKSMFSEDDHRSIRISVAASNVFESINLQ